MIELAPIETVAKHNILKFFEGFTKVTYEIDDDGGFFIHYTMLCSNCKNKMHGKVKVSVGLVDSVDMDGLGAFESTMVGIKQGCDFQMKRRPCNKCGYVKK